jgi:3-oxoacyl-[acyl-carrier protein] reductase
MDLKNKVALITGSSRGFGAEIARTFAKYGAKVVITYYSEDKSEKLNAEKIGKETSSELILPLDVTKRDSVKNVMSTIAKKYGKINILVNNAGINKPNDFDKQTEEEWNEVLSVDLIGVFLCCQEALPYLSDNGRVINIGSVSGQYGGPRTPSYAAAKGGVMQLTHCLARFVGHRNITVNCVSPGMIESPMLDNTMPKTLHNSLFPQVLLKRLGKANEVAETVAFLASDGAGYITAQTIAVNGGLWV